MKLTANESQFTKSESSGNLVAEASDFSLPAGVWPETIYLNMNNGKHVEYTKKRPDTLEGELFGWYYCSANYHPQNPEAPHPDEPDILLIND